MPLYLRQSTASQEIPLGHFVDSTDGVTAETALTIANTDIKLWLTGATVLANKNSGGATHISGGIYYCVLDATDTATIGPLVVFVAVSGALAVRVECVVLDEAVYDALFGTTALATTTNITAGTITTVAGSVGGNVVGSVGSVVGAVGSVTGAVASVTGTVGGIAGTTQTLDALQTALNSTHGAGSWATAVGFSTLTTADVRIAIGLASANLDTQLAAILAAISSTGAVLTAAERNAIADALITRNIAGGSSTGRTVRQVLAANRNKVAFDVPVAGQFTVFAEDDTTPVYTGTYTTDSGAFPVTVIDPA